MSRVKSSDKRPTSRKTSTQSKSREGSAKPTGASAKLEADPQQSNQQTANDIRSQLSALFNSSLVNTMTMKAKLEKNINNKSSIIGHQKWLESGYLEQPSKFPFTSEQTDQSEAQEDPLDQQQDQPEEHSHPQNQHQRSQPDHQRQTRVLPPHIQQQLAQRSAVQAHVPQPQTHAAQPSKKKRQVAEHPEQHFPYFREKRSRQSPEARASGFV